MQTAVELIRRFSNATAQALTGFLFGADLVREQPAEEQAPGQKGQDHESPSSEAQQPEKAPHSPLDDLGEAHAEALDNLGAAHQQSGEGKLSLIPEIGHDDGVGQSR